AHEGAVPAHTHRTWAVLRPPFVRHISDVLQLQMRAAAGILRERDVDPARLAGPACPGQPEKARRLAADDLASGVALELIAAADAQVAGDWQEPARNAFRIGERVPKVVDAGVVGAGSNDDARGAALVLAGCDLTCDRTQRGGDVDLHGASPGIVESAP